MRRGTRPRRWLAIAIVGAALILGLATAVFWGDLVLSWLDPKVPFQTYRPPPAPDFASRAGWALLPTKPDRPTAADPGADVFFIAPTSYVQGHEWNAPVGDERADRLFRRVMAPNYAGPFVRVGRIFAPRYRQASLYSLTTLRDDAQEARRFAYGDVAAAFRWYLAHYNQGRPLLIVGVEQGGVLGARLLAEEVGRDPAVRARLVAAYLIDTVTPADAPPAPPCGARGQTGCLAAWASVREGDAEGARVLLARALVWTPMGELGNLGGRPALCFNPILGAVSEAPAPGRVLRGARPAFLARQVSARCVGGVLQVSRPKSASLKRSGSWLEQQREPGFNLFYADLEADAKARAAAWRGPGREGGQELMTTPR